MPLHRNPRERLDAIERQLDRDSVDDELRDEIEAELPEIYREYIALESEKAFEQHMAKYITDAYTERQQGDRGPLCTCPLATCPLTNGQLPAKLRYNANSIFKKPDGRKRVLEHLHSHQGGEVLHEMLEAWDDREGKLHRRIAQIHNRLMKGADDIRELPTA